jgi:hypothetical protein
MRVPFSQVFSQNPDGTVTPRSQVTIGGVTMGPGVTFTRGVAFSGIDIASMAGRDLEVEYQGQVVVVKGVY